ncbi:MAG: hypothetical protein IGS38_00600 [Synechococcales cyanobacterium M58_A2018_015]|nr:hypothetical protein [Synechococcales cyanobacterium M58_A2018_015]
MPAIALRNLQKVEFRNSATECNIAFTEYEGPGSRSLLVTGVPAGAGTMLGAVSSRAFFYVPPQPPIMDPEPVVYIELRNVVPNGVAPNVDSAEYGGRIELREFGS